MDSLLALLAELCTARIQLIFVYVREAHSDDSWPLGYGIKDHRNLEDRWAACDALLEKYPALRETLDNVVVDCMDDDFLHNNGAWPERYFFVDKQGTTLWASDVAMEDSSVSLTSARAFASQFF